MLSIGDLARVTRTTVRMLRHYDELGLVVPDRVDAATGYRWYAAAQIERVDRLVALKELGFTLEECGTILAGELSVDELRGMLRLRRSDLARRMVDDAGRLAEVERRLASIEEGTDMDAEDVILTELPALRVAILRGQVGDEEEIGAGLAVLVAEVESRISEFPGTRGRPIRLYNGRLDEPVIDIAAGVDLVDAEEIPGLDTLDLPREPRAASLAVRDGDVARAWRTFSTAIERRGLYEYGLCRQIHSDDGRAWIQRPVRDR